MGMTLDSLTKKLNTLSYYPSLFQNAFGDKTITSGRISLALSQFVRSIISFQSKYDEGRQTIAANANPAAVDFSNFTTEENRGKQLFFSPVLACAACHGTETFTAAAPKNNGLDLVIVDSGVGAITKNNAENGLFKITSLRNVELSAPYMHDGRFKTLDEVVEHYNSGIMANNNLSTELKNPNGTPKRLNLSAQDKAALVAFLKTLTDKKMTADVKYSSPFN
jgi:cytochrome c peroxidase